MTDSYATSCLDVLSVVGSVRSRRMFGGHGIYHGSLMFALVADDVLYMKADEETRAVFKAAGSSPFVYAGKDGRRVTISYWEMPPEGFESPTVAERWATLALDAARRAAPRGAA